MEVVQTGICVGAWVQFIFDLLVVDSIYFASSGDKFRKQDGIRYVFMIFTRDNGGCYWVHVDKSVNYPYGVMETETTQVISVTEVQELSAEHVFDGVPE